MQEADGDDGGAAVVDEAGEAVHFLFVDRLKNRARGIEPLGDSEGQVRVHKRRPWRNEDVVELGARLPPDLQDVFEPARSDQCHSRALAFQHGVGGHGGAMNDVEGRGLAGEVSNAVENRARRVVGGGPLLVDDETIRPQMNEVGERTTGVDADT